ncbi:hypothetical protein [Halobacteriovorax sp. YZS-1-1]|uniref:hypothetical protein n=1 Tax=unclassified Halobacteriovorax TaxID=2639665 RepID=UPI00399BEBB0
MVRKAYDSLKSRISNLRKGKEAPDNTKNESITLKIVANNKIVAFLTMNESNKMYSLTYTTDFLTSGIPPFNLSRNERPKPGFTYESESLWYAFVSRLPNPNRPDFDRAMENAGLNGDEGYLEILGKLSRYSISKSWSIELDNQAA